MISDANSSATDLVTGGCGFIGRHLVAALLARGGRVRVFDIAPTEDLPPAVEFVQGSILDPEAVARALSGIRYAFHLAGIAKLWLRDKSDYQRINVEGTAAVMRAAIDRNVQRVVHCSTEAILLPKTRALNSLIDESVLPDLADMPGPYTRSKHLAEQAVLTAVHRGLDAVIINPTVPIGANDRNLTPPAAMISMFLNGEAPAFLDCTLNLVDVRDVAAGMILAAQRGRRGERYLLGGENVSLRDLLKLLESIGGKPMPRRAIPGWLALTSAMAAEWVADYATHRAPAATREGVMLGLRSRPLDGRKARSELSFSPRPVQEALAEAVAWLKTSTKDPR